MSEQNSAQSQLAEIAEAIHLHGEILNKGGRPRKTIDELKIIELAAKGYRMNEIATLCGVSRSTLNRRYEAACEKGRELMRGALRAKQMEVAMKGNPIMLIWLGKQELQQTDKQDIDVTRRTIVNMVVGIDQRKLNALTGQTIELKALPPPAQVDEEQNETA